MAAFPQKEVLNVAVTGACGQIGYSLLPLIARGLMLGASQKVALRLLDIEPAMKALNGVVLELQDCALPLLTDAVATFDSRVAFKEADVVIMCGAFPRKPGMERKDMLVTNAKIFREQGAVLKEVACPHVRILVVGNPANTNALIVAATSGLPRTNISALTRLDHNRAAAQVAMKAGVNVADVKNCIIWGNHSGTQVPDTTFATAAGKSVADYATDEFIQTVQQRGAAVMNARGLSSAMSAAKAITDHVHDWILGTPADGSFVSMGVISDGNGYGVAENLIFSFPVTCSQGVWKVVEGLQLPEQVKARVAVTEKELLEEREQAEI